MKQKSRPVLCVGLVCVDIICVCAEYPREDTDESFLQSAFGGYGIDISHCVYYDGSHTPISIVTVNEQNGSRTIRHSNKDLPELTFKDFQTTVDLTKYKWIHFEGRTAVEEIKKMLQYIEDYNTSIAPPDRKIITSVELEKMRPNLTELFGLTDYVFVSKDYAHFQGYVSKETAAASLVKLCLPGATLICPWGVEGTIATVQGGATYTTPIFAPVKLVDTLGAGDTFVASTIFSLSTGHTLQEAIIFGSKVAGAKCGMQGFDGLREEFGPKLIVTADRELSM